MSEYSKEIFVQVASRDTERITNKNFDNGRAVRLSLLVSLEEDEGEMKTKGFPRIETTYRYCAGAQTRRCHCHTGTNQRVIASPYPNTLFLFMTLQLQMSLVLLVYPFWEFPEPKFISMIVEKDFLRFVWIFTFGEEVKIRIGRMFAVCLFTSGVVSSRLSLLFRSCYTTLHSTMLPALRSRTNLNRVLTQTLAVILQRESFRVPVQNSSAVSVLTDEQRAFNLKIWPGNQQSLSLSL